MKQLDFIFFDAGGGHRSAALALKEVIENQRLPWKVRLVNLQEVLDELDVFRKITGLRLQDVYNLMLKKGMTLGSFPLLRGMHGLIRLYHRGQVRLLSKFWSNTDPDLVVSLVPNFNRALFQGLRSADRQRQRPDTPMVTILTDMADFPPHFWIENQSQYFVCGTGKAVTQARDAGHPEDHVFRTSGMILKPKFYVPVQADRRVERERMGLHPTLPTGLVLFGGEGSESMLDIARRVDRSGLEVQLILICGRNEELQKRLNALKLRIPKHVEGFTAEIPYFMHLSDFMIGKPGPGSVSEALAMNLPVIVERNAWTLVQERYNTEWIEQHEVGVVLDSFRHIETGLKRMLEPEPFARFRAKAAAIENGAVFEIPEMLSSILQRQNCPVQSLSR